ncbi:unnamed protein product [Phyllotreta striolata]|uniref:X-box-binding protein 1 n=1 Tax=Phyllotreta striolata TaxID=444603 RepID=A0A9N9TZN2_PHYSR|nr:unnamed protein product [Phyllotreta striolata]
MINVKHETTDDAMSCNTSVTSILKYLDDKSLEMDQLRNLESRPKKRRLDHLTWEEKIQRKKLKNRVAAQTSRDRKKAKMEQMEQAVQQLFANNETLLAQCESLKLANQRLVKENAELHERLRAPCASCAAAQSRPVGCEALNGPTEKSHVPSSGFEQRAAESHSELPSLPDLLDELDTDIDFSSLEQLTQSLLQDIARDLEDAAQKTDREEPKIDGNRPAEMVGQTPTELESGGSDKKLENSLSEYLLLYHNYAAAPETSAQKPVANIKKSTPVPIRPKIVVEPAESAVPATGDVSDVVTIVIDNEGNPVTLNEAESVGVPSPMSSTNESDKGYESLDSPHSLADEDLWDQSITELFPSLYTV